MSEKESKMLEEIILRCGEQKKINYKQPETWAVCLGRD